VARRAAEPALPLEASYSVTHRSGTGAAVTRNNALNEGSHGCCASARMSAPENENNRIKAAHARTHAHTEWGRGWRLQVPGGSRAGYGRNPSSEWGKSIDPACGSRDGGRRTEDGGSMTWNWRIKAGGGHGDTNKSESSLVRVKYRGGGASRAVQPHGAQRTAQGANRAVQPQGAQRTAQGPTRAVQLQLPQRLVPSE
jgi:hypothetical protein